MCIRDRYCPVLSSRIRTITAFNGSVEVVRPRIFTACVRRTAPPWGTVMVVLGFPERVTVISAVAGVASVRPWRSLLRAEIRYEPEGNFGTAKVQSVEDAPGE